VIFRLGTAGRGMVVSGRVSYLRVLAYEPQTGALL